MVSNDENKGGVDSSTSEVKSTEIELDESSKKNMNKEKNKNSMDDYEKKQAKKIKRKEKKIRKQNLKEDRHFQGKYYFWEFNKINFSKMKIWEVNFFFFASIAFGIIFLITPIFAISKTENPWQLFMFLIPTFLILWGFVNRFIESILSNIKNRNRSLFFQRFIGIMYIIVLTLYVFVLLVLRNNETVAVVEIPGWLLFNLLISIVLIGFKVVGVSWYGNAESDPEWPEMKMKRKEINEKRDEELSKTSSKTMEFNEQTQDKLNSNW